MEIKSAVRMIFPRDLLTPKFYHNPEQKIVQILTTVQEPGSARPDTKQLLMELDEVVLYLGAVAASDAPIDGREKDLLRHLLRDFGATQFQADELVAALPEPFQVQPTLNTLSERTTAIKLLRAMLVIAYCDGSFDPEEVPFLTPVIGKFSLTSDELSRAKQQAFYFLRPAPPSISLPQEVVNSGNWELIQTTAREQFELYRNTYFERFRSDLKGADADTCYLAMSVGPPSFDLAYEKERFLNSHPDMTMMDEESTLALLRDEAERKLRSVWEAAYAPRCNSCYLDAPGKRRDLCPRCGAEYGEPPRR